MRGCSALRDVLDPDGAMHLMVYAPYGRTGIYMLQEFCRRLGIRADRRGDSGSLAALRALPPGHPLENLLREAPDFRQEAALADALLHPQDRAYSVPQLFDFIDSGGLTFGRWVKQAPYSPRCGVMAQDPAGVPHGAASAWPSNTPPPNCFAARWFATVVVATGTTAPRRAAVNFDGDAWPATCPFACRTRSVFRSGCRQGPPRC